MNIIATLAAALVAAIILLALALLAMWAIIALFNSSSRE